MLYQPNQVLCIDRKAQDVPAKARQTAFVERFAQGCNGITVSSQEAVLTSTTHPWCIRGMKFTGLVQQAWQEKRTFYYIDNGYFGNQSRKNYFRIIKNHVHDIRPVIQRDNTRLIQCPGVNTKSFTPGRKILLAPPSPKSFTLWNINQDQWIEDTVAQIKQHTDRPIEIRLKRIREERLVENTMEQALADDVHCLVTYNSVAAVEAVILGKPAIVLGPNAAAQVASCSIEEIENPRIPTHDERQAWLNHLSYSQFTFEEMSNGTAWRILNDC
jgi:hypothetical protein